MIHKARRIEIDTKELSEAQMNMVNLFLRLIEINTKFGFKDKETLIQKLNEIKAKLNANASQPHTFAITHDSINNFWSS